MQASITANDPTSGKGAATSCAMFDERSLASSRLTSLEAEANTKIDVSGRHTSMHQGLRCRGCVDDRLRRQPLDPSVRTCYEQYHAPRPRATGFYKELRKGDCQVSGVTGAGGSYWLVGKSRPSKVIAKALRAGFQRFIQRS
jgi:hypothetical protein